MKKTLSLILAVLMLLGCTSALAQDEFPIVNEPLTLTALIGYRSHFSDPATNNMNLIYEEKTGIHIDWTISQDLSTDVNLMIAGEQNVDMWLIPFNPERVMTMVEAGMLMPLNELIDQYAPNVKAVLEENPEYKANLTAPDGNIYTLFETDCGLHMPNRRKLFVKKTWLDAYRAFANKADAPQTYQEFQDMLTFFRDKDPNGNGIQDEIPLIGSVNGEDDPIYFLMSPFSMISNSFHHIENGKVVFEANTDAWREGLKWIAMLNKEGLLYGEDSYVQDRDQLRALVNVGEPSNYLVGAIPTFWEGRFVDSSVLNWTDYEAIAPIAGPEGESSRRAVSNGPGFSMQCALSSACVDPVAAIRWLDWWISEEGSFANNWGMEEGVDYQRLNVPALNGDETSVAYLKDSYTNNFRYGENLLPKMDRESIRYAASLDESTFNTSNAYVLYKAGKLYQQYWVPTNLPTIVWCNDMDLINTKNELGTLINDCVKNAYTEFILGLRDINNDAEWESYLDELDSLGLDAYLEYMTRYYGL